MNLPFIAFTAAANFFLDEEGVCRGVEPANGKTFSSVREASEARRCVGATYFAAGGQDGFVDAPTVGAPLVFRARDAATHTSYFVRTDALIRFHARKDAPKLARAASFVPPFVIAKAPARMDSVAPASTLPPVLTSVANDPPATLRDFFEYAPDESTELFVSDDDLEPVTGVTRIAEMRTPTMRKLLPAIPKYGPVTPPGLSIYQVAPRKKTGTQG